jgi:4-amino-4-deoxy-L-arabinose transferase-like glycosyltransferase
MDVRFRSRHFFKRKIIFVWISLMILALGWSALVLVKLANDRPDARQKEIKKSASNVQDRSLQLEMVLQKSKLALPDIKTARSQDITAASLPSALTSFIHPSAQQVKSGALDYGGGEKGFHITYQVVADFGALRNQFIGFFGSGLLGFRYNDLFSVIEGKRDNQNIRVLLELSNSGNDGVDIQTSETK